MWTYSQQSGVLRHNDQVVAKGYSGRGAGRNNPAMEAVKRVGPIPRGWWVIHSVIEHSDRLGPIVIPLRPDGHDACGRAGFCVHGDSVIAPGMASEGCIIVDRPTRLMIVASKDTQLMVTV